jgi:ABC-2 type transport system ATP-binding protein
MDGLALSGIKKSFRNKHVLADVSLEASAGECVGILGGNGSGKTTLLSILAGILAPDGGSFLWQGQDLFADQKRRQRLVGFVPQGTPLLEELSARDNLRLWYDSQALERELSEGKLALLGIPDFIDVRVAKLSGGMKKRLSIGCAIAAEADILLLDEPLAALDLLCKMKIMDYLAAYKKSGHVALFVSHDTQGLELCDRWYILRGGVLIPYQYDGNIGQLAEML